MHYFSQAFCDFQAINNAMKVTLLHM